MDMNEVVQVDWSCFTCCFVRDVFEFDAGSQSRNMYKGVTCYFGLVEDQPSH